MASLLEARNHAIEDNGPPLGDERLSEHGSSWLYALTAIFGLSLLCMRVLSFRPFKNEKIFHYLFGIALFVALVAYYASASGLAYVVVTQANQISRGLTRQIYWSKYVNWVVAFPVVILSLGLMSGISWATIAFNIALAWVWIISFLVAAFTRTNYKWGFFAFGLVAFFFLVTNTVILDGRRGATRVGMSRHHTILSGAVTFLWFMYILGWGLTDGGNRIGVTGSWIWFGILDFFFIPCLGFAIIFLARRWDYGAMNLHFTQYGRVARGADYPEKSAVGHGAADAGAGTAAAYPGGTTAHTADGYNASQTAGGTDTTYGAGPTAGGHTGAYETRGYGAGTNAGGTTASPTVTQPPPGQQYV